MSDLVERLRGDWPEILVEKHWMMDSDAIDKQREEAADRIEALEAENERLREALGAYTEYCDICHGRGSIIEEDAITGAELWRDCPGCGPARAALKETGQ